MLLLDVFLHYTPIRRAVQEKKRRTFPMRRLRD
jgi:hypothetical protein